MILMSVLPRSNNKLYRLARFSRKMGEFRKFSANGLREVCLQGQTRNVGRHKDAGRLIRMIQPPRRVKVNKCESIRVRQVGPGGR
jgi:hypothetical protein